MRQWLSNGNSVAFLTLTMPHGFGESCAGLMDTIGQSFSAVFSGRPYRRDREAFGIEHTFKTWDATHGKNGWHPHIHGALFLKGHPVHGQILDLERSLFSRWATAVAARGHRQPSREHGIHLEIAHEAEAVAGYLLKIRGEKSGASLAMELTRGDLKTGGGRPPFEILRAFADTGDLRDLAIFHEWEEATKGRRFSRWSDGAREALLVDSLEDEDVVEKDVGGKVVYCPEPEEWHALRGTPGALCQALRVAEDAGAAAVASYVAGLRRRWRSQRGDGRRPLPRERPTL